MNKRSIITTILTIIILLLLSLIFYHVSNKKVSTNIDIDYPVFKNNKDVIIKRYLKDVNTKNITNIKYEIGKSNDYTTVLFKFYNKDNLENVETLIFNKNKRISLQELFDIDKLKAVIETKKNTENKEEIDYSKINILFNDKSTTFYIRENEKLKSPYIFHSSERLSKRAIDQFNVKIVPKNTVILSFKLTIGRVAITTMDSVTNEAIAQFQILNENVTTEYMYLYFKNLNFMNFGSTSSIATAINSQIIKSIPVIVPIGTINREFSNILIRYFKMMKENSIESDKLNKIRELLLIELI